MEQQTTTQDTLQSEMDPTDKTRPVEEVCVEVQPSEQDPLLTNMKQESATQGRSQNKVASTNQNQPGEEVKTVNIEMQTMEKESDKEIHSVEEDTKGGVIEVKAATNSKLQDEAGEALRESVVPSALTTEKQLFLFSRKMYLTNVLLVIVFLIAAVSMVLAVVALTAKNSTLGQPTSAPGPNAKNLDLKALQEKLGKQGEDLKRIQNEVKEQKEMLTRLANNQSAVLQGPKGNNGSEGPPGVPGEQGPPGVCNFTWCRHQKRNVTTVKGNSSVVTLRGNELEPGWKLVGATCSTVGAAEYVYKDEYIPSNNTVEYSCHCRGTSKLFVTTNNTITCVIYYWICAVNQTDLL